MNQSTQAEVQEHTDAPIQPRTFNQGLWSDKQHSIFVQLWKSNNWRQISLKVGTRTPSQVRSHAQKYFMSENNKKQKIGNNREAIIGSQKDKLSTRSMLGKDQKPQTQLPIPTPPQKRKQNNNTKNTKANIKENKQKIEQAQNQSQSQSNSSYKKTKLIKKICSKAGKGRKSSNLPLIPEPIYQGPTKTHFSESEEIGQNQSLQIALVSQQRQGSGTANLREENEVSQQQQRRLSIAKLTKRRILASSSFKIIKPTEEMDIEPRGQIEQIIQNQPERQQNQNLQATSPVFTFVINEEMVQSQNQDEQLPRGRNKVKTIRKEDKKKNNRQTKKRQLTVIAEEFDQNSARNSEQRAKESENKDRKSNRSYFSEVIAPKMFGSQNADLTKFNYLNLYDYIDGKLKKDILKE